MSLDSKCTIASRLAQFLRRNGDKVINGSCKLSLTTSALCLLNTLFYDMLNEEGRYSPDLSVLQEGEVVEDIQFLHSFVKKTTTLKLFHGNQTLRGGIDLSYFSSLTVLELRKIPAHLIIGLDLLSGQLKALICSRSIYLLKELFVGSMDGSHVIKTWSELRELNLSCNYLENLDQSLKSLPNIEILDISHNYIRNTDEIQVLKNLCFLNLSFNQLEHLPVLSIESCRRITKLYLRNNNLEDLSGLECLFNLEDLDVAYNLLSEYAVLGPLDKLKSLRMLNLEGNPLYFHKRHTALVCPFINPSVLNRGLQLNGKLFAVPCALNSNLNDLSEESSTAFHHQTSINIVVGGAESTACVPERLNNLSRSPSVISELDDNSVSSVASPSGTEEGPLLKPKNSNKLKSKSKKRKKMREAQIKEPVESRPDGSVNNYYDTKNIPSHIQAKNIIEARREERGETWLIPDLSQHQVNFTMPKVPVNTPVVNSLSIHMNTHTDIAIKLNSHLTSQSSDITNLPNPCSSPTKEMVEILDIAQDVAILDIESSEQPAAERERSGSRESDDIEILASNSGECLAMDEEVSASQDNLSDCDIYGGNKSVFNENSQSEMNSEEESEDSIFFVERIDDFKKQALSVTIGPKYIREKDVIRGKYLENLDLNSLVSVHSTSKEEDGKSYNEVHLEFDSVKPSKQKRVYSMENVESAKVMSKILQPFADAKTLKEVTVGALECLKCNSQFSKQGAHKILLKTKKPLYGKEIISSSYDSSKEYLQETDACPNCGNHILVEMENLPLPSIAMPSNSPRNHLINLAKNTSDRSPDTLSTGSASSGSLIANLFSSIKLSPIMKRKSTPTVQTDVNQDAEREITDVNQNVDHQSSVTEGLMRRNSSDITIISNPSQNSIVLYPDPSLEINLNTIIERMSQASLSPTMSPNNIAPATNKLTMPDHEANIEKPNTCDIDQRDNQLATNEEDHDFYSLTESLADQNNKPPTDVMSSGSERYCSPTKSKTISYTELDESSQLISVLGEKTIITHDMFSELDHRLKLHLEINIFGKEEEFEACLQTSIVPLATGDEFKGLFVISSKKLHIIKFLPHYNLSLIQCEPIEKVVQVVHSCSLGNLRQIKVILGNQGLTMSCGSNSHIFTLVIRDADICNSFSSMLSDLMYEPRFEFGKVKFFSSTSETLKQLQKSVFLSKTESNKTPEVLLHLFGFWWKSPVGENEIGQPVCIIITYEEIFISKILYKKQDSCFDLKELFVYHYTEVDTQKISDLISLKLKKDLKSVEMNFLNEASLENCDSIYWTIKLETKSSLFSFVNAVKSPWEEIFKVPLPLTSEEENNM